LAFGMLAGILSARSSGRGTVVDCSMVDGAAILSALTWSLKAAGMWKDERGSNLLDTGAPYYDVYRCADGEWVAVGALEPQFFAVLKEKLGLGCGQHDPSLRSELELAFSLQTREHFRQLLEGTDACFAPILSLSDAPRHPHNALRNTFPNISGVIQPPPAPPFQEP